MASPAPESDRQDEISQHRKRENRDSSEAGRQKQRANRPAQERGARGDTSHEEESIKSVADTKREGIKVMKKI